MASQSRYKVIFYLNNQVVVFYLNVLQLYHTSTMMSSKGFRVKSGTVASFAGYPTGSKIKGFSFVGLLSTFDRNPIGVGVCVLMKFIQKNQTVDMQGGSLQCYKTRTMQSRNEESDLQSHNKKQRRQMRVGCTYRYPYGLLLVVVSLLTPSWTYPVLLFEYHY